jgi:hypothetical protein
MEYRTTNVVPTYAAPQATYNRYENTKIIPSSTIQQTQIVEEPRPLY